MKALKVLNLFVLSFVLYLALVGTFHWHELLAGAGVALLSALLVAPMLASVPWVIDPRRWLAFLIYLPVFLWALIKANLHIAYLVLHPRLPIHPSIRRVKSTLEGPLARAMLANSITLTPGTLTVEVEGEDLYVHCVDARFADDKEACAKILAPFEKHIRRISK